MTWLKRLFKRSPTIDDPMLGRMTFDNGSWLALPNADRRHMVIFDGSETGPTEQQRSRYTEIVQRIDLLTEDSLAYLRSQRDYAESIGNSNLELYSVIITDGSASQELDFALEFSPDEDAIYGVGFVENCAVDCYLDH